MSNPIIKTDEQMATEAREALQVVVRHANWLEAEGWTVGINVYRRGNSSSAGDTNTYAGFVNVHKKVEL